MKGLILNSCHIDTKSMIVFPFKKEIPFTALTRSWTAPWGFEAILGFGTISGSYWVAKGGGGGSGCFGTSGRILLTSDSVLFFGTEL